MVACWCEPDHNAHYIDHRQWTAGSIEVLLDRLDDAIEVASEWLARRTDPNLWRQSAGLPQPKRPHRSPDTEQ